MRICPYCGKTVETGPDYFDYLEAKELWVFNHFCHVTDSVLDVVITIYGSTKEEVIQKWNGEYHAEEQTSESL